MDRFRLFPVTSVGSLPKPVELTSARANCRAGKISRLELEKIEMKYTQFWIDFQNEIDVDVAVDGEQYRGDMVEYFAENIDGFGISGLVRSYGNRYYRKPIIKSELKYKKPITVKWWKFAQKLSSKPVKGMLTGPYTIMDWSFNEYYPTRYKATKAIAKIIRREILELLDAGCKIIQIDEPAISVRPEEIEWIIEVENEMLDGIDAYFITHICYGAFEYIYPYINKFPFHNFDLEMSKRNNFPKFTSKKDITWGVVDVHSHLIESVEEIYERMKNAIKYVGVKNLWFDPDCGLKTRSVEEAKAKLKNIVAAAKKLRREYEG